MLRKAACAGTARALELADWEVPRRLCVQACDVTLVDSKDYFEVRSVRPPGGLVWPEALAALADLLGVSARVRGASCG